jgi:hypothetical protein
VGGDRDPASRRPAFRGTRTRARTWRGCSRALAALPRAVRDGAAAAGRKIALRADAGYFAGELARAAHGHGLLFAIGAKRISSMWKALSSIPRGRLAGRDRHGKRADGVLGVPAGGLARGHVLFIRGSICTPDRSPPIPAPGAAAPCTPDQHGVLFPELEQQPAIYAYSFICTSLDASTPTEAAAAEHWYRHRTSYEQVNTAWMWASLIAAAIAAWLHQLTGLILGGELVQGHDTCGGKAMIATLRRVLIATPARLVRHGGQLIMRLAPGVDLLPAVLAAIRAIGMPGPRDSDPKIVYTAVDNTRCLTRGIGSDGRVLDGCHEPAGGVHPAGAPGVPHGHGRAR